MVGAGGGALGFPLMGASTQWLFLVLSSPVQALERTPESGSPRVSWRGSVWGSSSSPCCWGLQAPCCWGLQAPKREFSVPSGPLTFLRVTV